MKSDKSFQPAKHKLELEERIDFLVFGTTTNRSIPPLLAMDYGNYRVSKANFDLLWRVLVQNCILPEDQVLYYAWLKELLSSTMLEYRVESMGDISAFFTSVLCAETNSYQHLPLDGMLAIEHMLIKVNTSLNYMEEVTAKFKRGGIAGATYAENDFKVKVPPAKLRGVSALWKIVLETSHEEVASRAIELLNKLYTKLGEGLEEQVAEISGDFVQTAIDKLKLFHEHVVNAKQSRSKEIVKLMRLIEQMLDDSERKGNGGITPLWGLPKGVTLRLDIINHIVEGLARQGVPDRFDLVVHSRVTIWQLKMLIANRLKTVPEIVSMYPSNNPRFACFFPPAPPRSRTTAKLSRRSASRTATS